MKSEIKFLLFKLALITLMLVLLIIKRPGSDSITLAVSMIMVAIAITFFRIKNPSKYKKDERIKKLSSHATMWSWLVTLIVVTMLYWNNYIDLIKVSSSQLITIIFLTMVVTILFFRFYFLRKPDAE